MNNVAEDPSKEDFKKAKQLAEELRQKLPREEFSVQDQVTRFGKRSKILVKPDPKIAGKFRVYISRTTTVPKAKE